MTEPQTREPVTEAGRRLDHAWPGSRHDRLEWRERILAIEAEASTAALREAADRVRALRDTGLDVSYVDLAGQKHSSRIQEFVDRAAVLAILESQP